MDEPIEIPFRLWTWVGLKNDVLNGEPDTSHGKGHFWGGWY